MWFLSAAYQIYTGDTSYWNIGMWFISQFCSYSGNWVWNKLPFFCTLWKGVCTDIFYILDYICRLEFDSRNNNSDNAPNSSVDEIQGVSPLPSCRFYTPVHDHGVHDFFKNSFIQKQFSQLIKVEMKISWRHISNSVPFPILREDFPHVVLPLSSLLWT